MPTCIRNQNAAEQAYLEGGQRQEVRLGRELKSLADRQVAHRREDANC